MNHERALAEVRKDCALFFNEIYREQPKTLVMGEGNPSAAIFLVGEAPGEQETLQGRPFVGKAGKNLDEFLRVVDLRREDLYITNVVKFRPTKVNEKTGTVSNRTPSREEILLCLRFLLREIEAVEPQVVVTLGNTPLQALLGETKTVIGSCHGVLRPACFMGVSCLHFPLYHPASVIYNRALASVYREDLLRLRSFLEIQDLYPSYRLK